MSLTLTGCSCELYLFDKLQVLYPLLLSNNAYCQLGLCSLPSMNDPSERAENDSLACDLNVSFKDLKGKAGTQNKARHHHIICSGKAL